MDGRLTELRTALEAIELPLYFDCAKEHFRDFKKAEREAADIHWAIIRAKSTPGYASEATYAALEKNRDTLRDSVKTLRAAFDAEFDKLRKAARLIDEVMPQLRPCLPPEMRQWGLIEQVNSIEASRNISTAIGEVRKAMMAAADEQSGDSELTKLAKGLAMLVADPNLTQVEIAKRVGVHPKTITKSKTWEPLRLAKEAHRLAGRGKIPRGSKSKDGDLEAFEE